MNLKYPLVFGLSFLLIHCASQETKVEKKPTPEISQSNLTQIQAQERFQQIREVSYFLEFNLSSAEKVYSGKATLNFVVTHLDRPVRVDFYQGQIATVTANGKTLSPDYNGKYLFLSKIKKIIKTK